MSSATELRLRAGWSDTDFGSLGQAVDGPRGKRSKDDKEWYVLRRWLPELCSAEELVGPLTLVKRQSPDFGIASQDRTFGVEVAEATANEDQAEMSNAPPERTHVLGDYGGRGSDGFLGDEPEEAVGLDVTMRLNAKRKNLSRYNDNLYADQILLLYVNSNPGVCVYPNRLLSHLPSVRVSEDFQQVWLWTPSWSIVARDGAWKLIRDDRHSVDPPAPRP